jgi:CheY-like chemotaxis protein
LKSLADVVNAIAVLAWPLIAGLVLWRLFPSIKKIAESRRFTVKVGGIELTAQEFLEKSLATTADIQGKLASVTAPVDHPAQMSDALPARLLNRVLWVDDVPSNNFYEVAQLQTLGVDVVQTTSTGDGLAALFGAAIPFDAVVSDMGRDEPSGFSRNAGLDLIRRIRERDHNVPVFIYASTQALARRSEIVAAGGNGVTASPTELFALLRAVGSFPGPRGT